MSRARAALALLLFGYAGCGGASMVGEPTTVTPERESPAELEGEQISLTDDLETVLARPEPDCEAACDLGGSICDLSERICAIADRHPRSRDFAGRCTDSAARCGAARERIAAASCGCASSAEVREQ
ncbi:MAG: hypothetical protein RLP09_43830 [Sandaracinaceae bacterium]|nr:MAG: hypothetical protein EVA89_28605 [Sandaracinaceae bacterium]HBQ15516.1 hypothetical protein [Myxococcales bacterium]